MVVGRLKGTSTYIQSRKATPKPKPGPWRTHYPSRLKILLSQLINQKLSRSVKMFRYVPIQIRKPLNKCWLFRPTFSSGWYGGRGDVTVASPPSRTLRHSVGSIKRCIGGMSAPRSPFLRSGVRI